MSADLAFPAILLSLYLGTSMNNKTIAQSAVFIVIFAVVIWLAADMFLEGSPETANTATETKVITQHRPPPEKVSSETMHEATSAIQSPEVKMISSVFNEKFLTLRQEQLNLQIAQVIASKRKVVGSSRKANRTALPSSDYVANVAAAKGNSSASSAFADATLTYFDYDRQKALIRYDQRVIPVFKDQAIGDMTVVALKENGVLISKGNTHRLLIAPKTRNP